MDKLKIEKQVNKELLMLKISGELDASTAIKLDDEINGALESNQINILVDCGDLNYISSAGFGVFVSYIKDLQTRAGKFVLYNLSNNVFETFKILGLNDLLTIADTEKEAKSFFDKI